METMTHSPGDEAGRLRPAVSNRHRPEGDVSVVRARRSERGMTTAEYAVGTVAAVSFAGILIKILTDPAVQEALLKFIVWVISQFIGMAPFGQPPAPPGG